MTKYTNPVTCRPIEADMLYQSLLKGEATADDQQYAAAWLKKQYEIIGIAFDLILIDVRMGLPLGALQTKMETARQEMMRDTGQFD